MIEFKLNEVEEKRVNDFIKWHKRCRPQKSSPLAQYAPYKYIITPCGIGTAVSIICPYCKKEKDVTDIDSW